MKKLFGYLVIVLSNWSCSGKKDLPLPLHTVAYEMEISPFDKYNGHITYTNEQGKLDSTVTSRTWHYEFQARSGAVVKTSVVLKPKDPLEREVGFVYFSIRVDGNVVTTDYGLWSQLQYKIR